MRTLICLFSPFSLSHTHTLMHRYTHLNLPHSHSLSLSMKIIALLNRYTFININISHTQVYFLSSALSLCVEIIDIYPCYTFILFLPWLTPFLFSRRSKTSNRNKLDIHSYTALIDWLLWSWDRTYIQKTKEDLMYKRLDEKTKMTKDHLPGLRINGTWDLKRLKIQINLTNHIWMRLN